MPVHKQELSRKVKLNLSPEVVLSDTSLVNFKTLCKKE